MSGTGVSESLNDINRSYSLLTFIFRALKKAVCCLKRRRRLSCDTVPLTNIGIVPNVDKEVDQAWNSWEDPLTVVTATKPVDPVQQQIELYRQHKIAASNETNNEQKVDYFQDMAPKIIKQKKMVLQPKEQEKFEQSINFSLAPDPIFGSSELGVWDDSQSWEDQAEEDWDANNMIREKKRIDRERRLAEQQRKRLERESRGRSLPTTRLS